MFQEIWYSALKKDTCQHGSLYKCGSLWYSVSYYLCNFSVLLLLFCKETSYWVSKYFIFTFHVCALWFLRYAFNCFFCYINDCHCLWIFFELWERKIAIQLKRKSDKIHNVDWKQCSMMFSAEGCVWSWREPK